MSLIETLASLRPDERYAIDTETTGLRPWGDTILRGVSLYVRGEAYYVPLTHPHSNNQEVAPLAAALAACKAMPIYHNANYDRAILERARFDLPKHYRDTVLLAWMTDENRPKGLKQLGEIFFGLDAAAESKALRAMMRGRTAAECYKELRAEGLPVAEARDASKVLAAQSKRTWADLTANEIAEYAKQDAVLTYDLYDRLTLDPEYTHVEVAVQRMHDLQGVVYRMVKHGVQILPEVVRTKLDETQREMSNIQQQFGTVNLDSPKQLAKLIYETWGLPIKERTEKGEPSTSRAALEALAGSNFALDEVLRYRRLGKSASSYYLPFLDSADESSRIHPSVNVVGTVTGRFSYNDPNLQTIPREGTILGIKDCFTASRGRHLVSYDLRQAELRFMASLAGERVLMAALEAGADIYQQTADSIGTTRQIAKGLVLSWPYGVGPVKFARTSGLSVKESRKVIHDFEDTYPRLTHTMSKLSQYADIHGKLPLLGAGRFRRFVGPHLQWPIPSYTALNAACQGGVADFMGDVMIEAEAGWNALGATLVLQVHDSLVFEVEPGIEQMLFDLLTKVADDMNPLAMPLIWEMKPGL